MNQKIRPLGIPCDSERSKTALMKNFSLAALEKMQADQSVMNSDIHGDAEYRAHLVEIMTRRAVAEAIAD